MRVVLRDRKCFIVADSKVNELTDIIEGVTHFIDGDNYVYSFLLTPYSAYTALRYASVNELLNESFDCLRQHASQVRPPQAKLSEDKTGIILDRPVSNMQKQLMETLYASRRNDGSMRIPVTKFFDFVTLNRAIYSKHNIPFILSEELMNLMNDPIEGYDGTLSSLKNIPISELRSVSENIQPYTAVKKSKKTLQEKLAIMGVETLFDLLMKRPLRFHDKNNPIDDLAYASLDDECCVTGTITSINLMQGNKTSGVNIVVQSSGGKSILVRFFRQEYLLRLYSAGDDVLIMGKKKIWSGKTYLNGSSIDKLERGSLMPMTPIYSERPSLGVDTKMIISLIRELLSRMYATNKSVFSSHENNSNSFALLSAIHLPKNKNMQEASLAFWAEHELTLMQAIMLRDMEVTESRKAVPLDQPERNLQRAYIQSLPYSLTNSQVNVQQEMNTRLSRHSPTSTLLNGDVGSGKTLCGHLVALRAVECGKQAVLMSPTDVLAQQLNNGLKKMAELLSRKGENVNVVFYSGDMKAKEKREAVKKIESGEADIIVGTHSLISQSLTYHDLGVVIIDEQQKFGAEQRSALLKSRKDDAVPHLMMMTATPIPRAVAQIYYGDVSLLMMTDKPEGRTPVETEWVESTHDDSFNNLFNDIWMDVDNEIRKGNQAFVVTPMVYGSDKVDVASVEGTVKNIHLVLPDARVCYIHGKMKKEQQHEVMKAFRDKKYDVLVASTVVEVGVDVPDATRIVILSSDRLGASTLHQLRGRVGRSSKPSKCYLVCPSGVNKSTDHRMSTLVSTNDGFEVAQSDLRDRGEGVIFGDRQHGKSDLNFVNVYRHAGAVNDARRRASEILLSSDRDRFIQEAEMWFNFESRRA